MILDEILKHKKEEVEAAKLRKPLRELKREISLPDDRPMKLHDALAGGSGVSIIAEIKRMSPSKGILREDFNALDIARSYARYGARALSVLTDEKFFGGSAQILAQVRTVTSLPILRKDFIVDEYQVFESKLMGADAILLIASALTQGEMKAFYALAESIGIECLFEVHSAEEMEKIRPLGPRLVGVNNRDLSTFHVDIKTTERLAPLTPPGSLLVSESGIQTAEDLLYLTGLGVKAALVGESLITSPDPGRALEKLLKNG
jgi:indole-3-glycerol phosphate synthase